jgi:hypothetical protein
MNNINVGYTYRGDYQVIVPPIPTYSGKCAVNNFYQAFPPNFPGRRTTLGANSLKKLYEPPVLPYGSTYPAQTMVLPVDSLYSGSHQVFYPNGERMTYGAKLYPFTHRSPKEYRERTGDGLTILPYPAIQDWTMYPVAGSVPKLY